MEKKDFVKMQPIFINYGQKACKQEWNSVCNISVRLAKLLEEDEVAFYGPKRIELSCTSENYLGIFQWSKSKLITGNASGDPYVENRNMILLSVAASFVETQIKQFDEGIIITGFRDEWEDTQRHFVGLINGILLFLLSKKEKRIKIEAPITDYGPYGKTKMVKDFQRYMDIIRLTWSCYTPVKGEPCGRCEACKQRTKAFCADARVT